MDQKFIGIISDTHGLMRPEALHALQGADLIIHTGDIGSHNIISALSKMAPTIAVRGNVDEIRGGGWVKSLPVTARVDWKGVSIFVLHELKMLDCQPFTTDSGVIVSGHSHQPWIKKVGDVLYINPGSAGPRRFRLPVTVARLWWHREEPAAEIVDLCKLEINGIISNEHVNN